MSNIILNVYYVGLYYNIIYSMGIARAACTYIALLHFLHGSNQICGDKKPLMVTSDVVNGLALLRMRMIIIVTI